MKKSLNYKKSLIGVGVLLVAIVGFFVHALAGLASQPIVYAEPPTFVEEYVATQDFTTAGAAPVLNVSYAKTAITKDYAQEKALVHRVFFDDQSPDPIYQQLSHPNQAQRVKMALAFAETNIEFTHDEPSGFAPKREQFWLDAAPHLNNLRNALFEALIVSAREKTNNHIPYTLAWMPGQGPETVDMFVWAAKHHSDFWVRRFAIYFVARFAENPAMASELVKSSVHDPDYRIRRHALTQRYKMLVEY